jgi:hypothetical protein
LLIRETGSAEKEFYREMARLGLLSSIRWKKRRGYFVSERRVLLEN